MAMVLVHSALVSVRNALPDSSDVRSREQICGGADGTCSKDGRLRAVRRRLRRAVEQADLILLPSKEYVHAHSLEWTSNPCLHREYTFLLSEVDYFHEKVVFLGTDKISPSVERTLSNIP